MGQKSTLNELRGRVFRKLGIPAMDNPAVDMEDIRDCINEACREISIWTHCNYAEYTTSSVAEQQEYDFGDIGGIDEELAERTIRVRFKIDDTTWKTLDIVSKRYLDEDHEGWLNATSGDPAYVWIHDNFLGLYPKPDASYTDAIWWEGFEKCPTLVNNGDVCEIPAEYHRYIVELAYSSYKGDGQAIDALEAKLIVIGRQHEMRRVAKTLDHISVKGPYRGYD